jgi:hypothetical protein
MAVVSNNRRPRASIRSLLPNFHFLVEEKYPWKSSPEEEGKQAVSLGTTFVSVAISIGAAVFEVSIDPFRFNVSTSEHYRETKVWSLLWSNREAHFAVRVFMQGRPEGSL